MSIADYIASPSVSALARQLGVDPLAVARHCGRQRIAHEDIRNFIKQGGELHQNGSTETKAAGAQAMAEINQERRFWDVDHANYGPIEHETLSGFSLAAADNLSASNRLIPQVTHHDRADMRAVETLRKRMKVRAEENGVKLTALAFHIKVLTVCLRSYPRFNASLAVDGKTLILKKSCHIGIAVDAPHGLVVPVIRDTDKKGLIQIAGEIIDLAGRAQKRKIKHTETGGASMSLSNLGGIGGSAFTPIVNPPEVAILGISRTETVPVWENDDWVPALMAPLDLSYDHRVINGADAARFLKLYTRLIEDPRRLLV